MGKSKSKAAQKAVRRRQARSRKDAVRRSKAVVPPKKRVAKSEFTPPVASQFQGPGSTVTVHEEVAQTDCRAPHVVILGAGASRAACPNGDASGRKLPVMKDFLDIIDLGELPGTAQRDDFEAVYSMLVSTPEYAERCKTIEETIYNYFATMRLPAAPTIYDYLVLSLRSKDVIATFNWDPFLLQALQRCYRQGDRAPRLLFLHGNVLAGYCAEHHRLGRTDASCPVCKRPFTPSKLLYPVVEKRYDEDPLIVEDWRVLRDALQRAFMVTIFGYSAPKSDVAARELLLNAWGGSTERALEQFELIDIREGDDLLHAWNEFIHTHHYDTHTDFFDSWIANHPRRTGEAYWNQNIEAKWINPNPVPQGVALEDLVKWYEPLRAAEHAD